MRERIEYIDAIKGIAILMIFSIHMENWMQFFKEVELIQRIIHKGVLGVEFTYFINAYLLCEKQKNEIKPNKGYIWGVVVYNTLRIFPLYILSLLIFLIYDYTGILNQKPSLLNVISHFLMLAWLNPDWWWTFPGSGYIQTLFLMWLLFPIYKKIAKDFESSLCTFAILYVITSLFIYISVIINRFIVISSSTWDYLFYICRGMQSFALGTIFSYIPQKKFEFKNRKTVSISLVAISLASCALLVFSNCEITYLYLPFFLLLFFALKIYPLRLFVNPLFCFLGRYIFGIYIFHILLYFLLKKIITNHLILLFADFALSLLLSFMLTNFFERPVIRYLKGNFFS